MTAAEARVPKRLALGEGGDLSIRSLRREASTAARNARWSMSPGPPGVDLFAEGPTPQWALPVPAPVEGAPAGSQRFAFDLDGAPTGEKYQGALLTLTAVAPGRASRSRPSRLIR